MTFLIIFVTSIHFPFSQREFSFLRHFFCYLHFYFQSRTSPTERFEALRYDSGLDSAAIVPYQRTSMGESTFGVIFHTFFSTTISRRKFSVRFSFERLTPTQSSLALDVLLFHERESGIHWRRNRVQPKTLLRGTFTTLNTRVFVTTDAFRSL